jgi:hypothetical protein
MTEAVERERWVPGAHRPVVPATADAAIEPAEDTPATEDTPAGGGAPAGGPVGAGSGGDGLAGELAAAAGRRWWNKWTLYLGAVVLLLAGFMGGVQVQKSYGDSNGAAPAAGRGQQRPAGGFAGARGGFPGGAGLPSGAPGGTDPAAAGGGANTTTGTVKLVDGTTLYVQTADGTVITVRTAGSTAVKIAKDGSLKDLKAGDPVTVEGATSDGTVTATRVTGQG